MLHQANTDFLREIQGRNQMATNLSVAVKEQKLDFNDGIVTIRRQVAGANKFTILDSTSIKEMGISDFHAGKLPHELGMILKSIYIGYASSADTTTEEKRLIPTLAFSYNSNGAPAQLKSAQIVIVQNDSELKRYPVAAILSQSIYGPTAQMGDLEFQHWNYISGENPLRIELELPSVELATTVRHFIEINLRGDVIKRNL